MGRTRDFLRDLLRRGKKGHPLMLGVQPNDEELTSVARTRAEFAKDLISSAAFQDAIQFMNEQIVQEIAATPPLDSDTLRVLRLRLEVVSEFPQVLWQFIDEYQSILAIKQQQGEVIERYTRGQEE